MWKFVSMAISARDCVQDAKKSTPKGAFPDSPECESDLSRGWREAISTRRLKTLLLARNETFIGTSLLAR